MNATPHTDTLTTVTGTAFVVAEYRAEENDAARPLYRDDVVGLFLSPASRRAAADAATGSGVVKEPVRLRTRYFDDMLKRQIAAGCRQVVLLGAGLDTRAIRMATPGVRFFEIDDAGTMAFKRQCLAQHGLGAEVAYIDGNYVTDGMLRLLLAHGLDVTEPTFVIWEGNTMYLDAATDRAILRELRGALPKVRVSFDYFLPAMVTRTTGDPGLTRVADNFAQMNAPWITAFRDLHGLADRVGLGILEDVTVAALSRVYRPAAPVPPFGRFYAIATLGSW